MAFRLNENDVSNIRKYSKIRYDKKLNKQINDVITRYNRKIDRLRRKGGSYILPQKITKQDLMDVSYTRRDLLRRLKNVERFTERGAEQTVITKGYAISLYELEYLKREKSRVKRKLRKEITRYETVAPTINGERTARTFAQMGDTSYLNALAKLKMIDVDIEELNEEQLKTYKNLLYRLGINKDYLAEGFRANYIDMFTKVGYYVGYPQYKMQQIIDMLNTIDAEKFYDLYRTEKSIKAVAEYYYAMVDGKIDPSEIQAEVFSLYDNLLLSLPTILKDYQ